MMENTTRMPFRNNFNSNQNRDRDFLRQDLKKALRDIDNLFSITKRMRGESFREKCESDFLTKCLGKEVCIRFCDGSTLHAELKTFDRFSLMLMKDSHEILAFKNSLSQIEIKEKEL